MNNVERENLLKQVAEMQLTEEPVQKLGRYYNPKNPTEYVESKKSLPEAIEILRNKKRQTNFVISLIDNYDKYKERLFDSYLFWIFKLAEEEEAPVRTVKLVDNVYVRLKEIFDKLSERKHPLIQWKADDNLGKIKVFPSRDGNAIVVMCGFHFYGTIEANDHFYPSTKCKGDDNIVILQLLLMSVNPLQFFMEFGKETGVCCICGRMLTDEISVRYGIGPICASRLGVY